ncbi:hypothetical protein NDU88_002444 [Pleurodeles waltl]|uniref:Uncharacterized protein n=1 Tax=Pleurodeles waltl TaxID=8319 RepID=A0AAV7MMN5_PLEWA|nr:hypothetical protein NDU88_002444 [Pleurodeles waltl]
MRAPYPLGNYHDSYALSFGTGGPLTLEDLFEDGMLMLHSDFYQTLFLTHAKKQSYVRNHWAPQGTGPVTHKALLVLHAMGHGRHLIRWLNCGIRAHLHKYAKGYAEGYVGN